MEESKSIWKIIGEEMSNNYQKIYDDYTDEDILNSEIKIIEDKQESPTREI